MKFPYFSYQVPASLTAPGVLFRPEIMIDVIGPAGTKQVLALVDTGSDDTLLPKSIGQAIGVSFDPSSAWAIGSLTGDETTAIRGQIEFSLSRSGQTIRWKAVIGFVDFPRPELEVSILGHVAFLEYFTATFDGQLRTLELVPNPNFPGTIT